MCSGRQLPDAADIPPGGHSRVVLASRWFGMGRFTIIRKLPKRKVEKTNAPRHCRLLVNQQMLPG
ncbi:hypothetical protein OUZ56_008405 [Daphnia magna]|uniref:Uncharacterized protein n=1 Tax=Daphnia magna TaxID=35525 RepID=A0ABR0AD67_9CRUS|nr:hypothetical protein OUZ56_008405 [Daphnia magna]